MSINFPTKIIADFKPGQRPLIEEITAQPVRINGMRWKTSRERINDVHCRCHVLAAGLLMDSPDAIVVSQDLYLADEYETFPHKEKCLTGSILAYLHRHKRIPLEPISYKTSPRPYRIVPDLIDLDLAYSPTLPRS